MPRTRIIPKHEREDVVESERPTPTVKPTNRSLPTGPVVTRNPKGQSYGIPWSQLTRWDNEVQEAASESSVPEPRLYGHMLIESQGKPRAVQQNNANGWSYGLLQVVPRYWRALINELAGANYRTENEAGNALLDNPRLAVRAGAAVLRRYFDDHQDWDRASSAFFTGNPNWEGADNVNGTRGGDYRRTLNQAITEFESATHPNQPEPPTPPKETDPYKIIMGGDYSPVTYGFLADAGLSYYEYGVGHGTTRATQHTGDDIVAACGTSLYAPAAGIVECVGSAGIPRWGQGCGAYGDVDGGGKGNLTIFLDAGIKLVLGHVREVFVTVGDRVKQGQRVATVGSMNGCHVHVEVAKNRNGSYWLVNPKPALAKALHNESPPIPEPQKPIVFGRVPHPPFENRLVTNSRAWDDLGPRKIVGSCRHSMVGSLRGTDGFFRGEARGKALTDYGIGGSADGSLDGVIYLWNDPRSRRAPWANGPTNGLEGDGPAFVRVHGVVGVNRDLVSIERSDGGDINTPLSEKQFESLAQLEAYWADQAKIPWNSFPLNPASGINTDLEHWELGQKECPFTPVRSQATRLQNRIRAILKQWQLGITPPPVDPQPEEPPVGPVVPKTGYPEGMDEALARTLFGEFTKDDGTKVGFDPSPAGVVSATWLSRGDSENEFPEAESWKEWADGKRYFTFKNGWVLVNDPAREKADWYWLGDKEGELIPHDS